MAEETTEKKARAPLKGFPLEMDVMKKIGFQLDRLQGSDSSARKRIIEFVSSRIEAQEPAKDPAPPEDLL